MWEKIKSCYYGATDPAPEKVTHFFFGKRYCFGWRNSIFCIVRDVVSVGKTVSFEGQNSIFWRNFDCFFEIIRHLTPHVSFLLDFQYVVLILFCFNSTPIWHSFDTDSSPSHVLERLKLSVMPPFLYLLLVLTLQFSRELRGLGVTFSEFTVRKVSNSLENWKESPIESDALVYQKLCFHTLNDSLLCLLYAKLVSSECQMSVKFVLRCKLSKCQ